MAMNPSTRANVILTLTDKMSPALRKVSAKLDRMAVRARRAGMAMGAAAVVLGTGLYKAANSAVTLDNNMRKVQARVTGISSSQLKTLTDEAVRLGGSTRYTTGQVSSLMATMAQAGIGAQGIKQMTGAMLDFATATGVGLDEASAIATRVANAYGLDHTLANITRVTDALTYATISAQVNVTELGETFEYAAKESKSYGQSLETMTTMAAFLGNVGITGSAAGTAMRALYRELATMEGQILRVNGNALDLTDSFGNMRQLPDIFRDLNAAMKGMSGLERAAQLQDLFGRLGQRGGLIGLDEYSKMNDMISDMDEIEGLTKKVALTMDAGIGGTIYRVLSAFDMLAVTIGNAIIPYIDMIARVLTNIATVVSKMMEEWNWLGGVLTTIFLSLAGGAAALLAFAGVATVLATAFSAMGTIVTGIGSAIAFLATPVGAIAAVVAGIAVVGTALVASFFDWKEVLQGVLNIVKPVYDYFNAIMGELLDTAKLGEFGKAWELMTLRMKLDWMKAADDVWGKGWRTFFVLIRKNIRETIQLIQIMGKNAVAIGMAVAASARGDVTGAIGWMLETDDISDAKKWAKQRQKWAEEDAALIDGSADEEVEMEIWKLEQYIQQLKEYTDAENEAADAKQARMDQDEAYWKDREKFYQEEKKLDEDWAKYEAEEEERKKKQFEKVNFDTLTTTGAVAGRSAAQVSANLARGMNQIMKDQLGTLVRIEKELKKDRPNKGIWMP
jgi:TP901 family phage tail tape measure protein